MTTAFQPNVGDIIVGAYARIQVRRPEITAAHMADARYEANLLQAQWGNKGPNLWTVDNQQMMLAANQVEYQLPLDTIDMLDSYLSLNIATTSDVDNDVNTDVNTNTPSTYDRVLNSLGRSEYLQIPYKSQLGQPTSFWYQKGAQPKISFWPVPDQAYQFNFWRLRQIADADARNGGTADVPYLWFDAFTAGLAHRLARIYAQPLEAARKADADEAWGTAAAQDVELVPIFISPDVGSYYR